MLSITLLGTVTASVADHPIRLHGRLGRTTLATLALDAGRPRSTPS